MGKVMVLNHNPPELVRILSHDEANFGYALEGRSKSDLAAILKQLPAVSDGIVNLLPITLRATIS